MFMPKLLSITGKTKVFGIFGDPVSHSLSPLMHNAAFEALHLPYCYLPFEVAPPGLERAIRAIIPLGIKGLNLTAPHKEAVIPFLDRLSREAQKSGAVNTIEVAHDLLIGHNTDGRGFVASLMEMNIDPEGYRVILLGAGGAARGVAIELVEKGAEEMVLINRNLQRARNLADRLISLSPRLKVSFLEADFERSHLHSPLSAGVEAGNQTTLLINTTPLGMKENDPLPFPPQFLDPSWVVADLIYRPQETPLLLAAQKRGAKIVSGTGMLLHQGALAFEIWTKEKAPIEVMRAAVQKGISTHQP